MEELYTLDEARTELRRRECVFNGHSLMPLVYLNETILSIICGNCSKYWDVVDPDGATE